MKDIQKDTSIDSETYISYSYVNNDNNIKIESINALDNKLFK